MKTRGETKIKETSQSSFYLGSIRRSALGRASCSADRRVPKSHHRDSKGYAQHPFRFAGRSDFKLNQRSSFARALPRTRSSMLVSKCRGPMASVLAATREVGVDNIALAIFGNLTDVTGAVVLFDLIAPHSCLTGQTHYAAQLVQRSLTLETERG
jgi:hypothetical protein